MGNAVTPSVIFHTFRHQFMATKLATARLPLTIHIQVERVRPGLGRAVRARRSAGYNGEPGPQVFLRYFNTILVGAIRYTYTPLKKKIYIYMKVSWDNYSQLNGNI